MVRMLEGMHIQGAGQCLMTWSLLAAAVQHTHDATTLHHVAAATCCSPQEL